MRILTLVTVGVFGASSLQGQTTQAKPPRQGFNIGFGLGWGSAGFSCDGCNSDRENSGAGYLRIGGTLREDVILAGEIAGWSKEENNSTLTVGTVNFVGQVYPITKSDFFMLAGLGFGSVGTKTTFGSTTTTTSGGGFGWELGTGYDWRVGRNFSLTPFATYIATAGVKIDDASLNGDVIMIGLGFTWH